MTMGARRHRRWVIAVATTLAVPLAAMTPALASWSLSGSGTAAALGDVMPSGTQPTASATGTSVLLQWSAASFAGGGTVAAYVVNQFNATTGNSQSVGPGCSGQVTGTSCTETGVPAGTWDYSISTVQHNWTGAAGPLSSAVTVT